MKSSSSTRGINLYSCSDTTNCNSKFKDSRLKGFPCKKATLHPGSKYIYSELPVTCRNKSNQNKLTDRNYLEVPVGEEKK